MIFFEANDIVKNYSKHQALKNVSVSIPEKAIYGLLGPNGAGKTTLIRIINQITAPDSGSLKLNGRPLTPKDCARIGYLPEERGLYKKMKVGEQAVYLARLKGLSRQEAVKRLRIWFEKFEITGWWNKKVEELSKGMQQKVQFITTVLHQPEMLIFDEPFSGFDPINAELLKKEILELRDKGATLIFSTHNMGSVEEICSHIALINKSRKIIEGPVNEIRENHADNTYRIRMEGPDDLPIEEICGEDFEITSREKHGNITALDIIQKKDTSPNIILSRLTDRAEILEYKKIIPKMNDIFIKLVKEDSSHE